MQDYGIDQYQLTLQRVCKCGNRYTIGEFLECCSEYFSRPWNYHEGCETYCLSCWLGVGPDDFPADADDNFQDTMEDSPFSDEIPLGEDSNLNHDHGNWPYEKIYESLIQGDILPAFQWFLDNGTHLAIMPIARLHVERTVVFPSAVTFYPPGVADLETLNLIPNQHDTNSLAELASMASGITRDILENHPLVVFPCRFNWEVFSHSGHEAHLDFIRKLSEEIDRSCLNFVRYRSCRLELIDNLPARAGQVASNHMMAGALLYNGALREARIIGGAAFTHYLTRGLGLALNQLEWDSFPQDGETGQIVNHALSLYTSLLESDSPTARFMQSLSLLEFLASPDEYQKFEKVSKIIARYIARDPTEYQRILERFFELTGKKDITTGRIIGYRTRVVHMGERIEKLVPDPGDRKQLFVELDRYIRPVIDHMFAHSEISFDEYLKVRSNFQPFEKGHGEKDAPIVP